MTAIKIPKKLIEVALPLDEINAACAHEKLVKVGKPTNIHLWWARRPLAAARAVIFSQMVNDPGFEKGNGFQRGFNKREAEKKREELFQIIRDLVKWENTNNEEVLNRAREAIWESWRETCQLNRTHPQAKELFDPEKLPAFHDPFAGGGVLPLEAQRLGLESYASDLNPVAVMINKAMIEIPPKFACRGPVGPIPEEKNQSEMLREWHGAQGLAEDVRRYGHWMREEAFKRIGHLYPKIKVTKEMAIERSDLKQYVGQELTVIAWLWARTVKSPNPAFSHANVPLASNFVLSTKSGKEAWVEPVIEGGDYQFKVRIGKPPKEAHDGTRAEGRGANFICLLSNSPISGDYIKSEGQAGRLKQKLMAIVAEGQRGRVYISPTHSYEEQAIKCESHWKPSGDVPARLTGGTCVPYGMKEWGDLFTPRQLMSLTTFSDLIQQVREKVIADAKAAGVSDDNICLAEGGSSASAYGDAIATYVTLAITRSVDWNNSLSRWESKAQVPQQLYGRQSIPMVWDFSEANILSNSTGSFLASIENIVKSFSKSTCKITNRGHVIQEDAAIQKTSKDKLISTDPPYYDNIAYADLSDFFYVWMRHCLNNIFPKLFKTLAVPKAEELVASSYRHGGKDKAELFFMNGMTKAMRNLAMQAHPAFPVSIYYAFKQSETKEGSTSSTGWETFLEAVLEAGFSIDGTWPMSTENRTRMIASGTNALASSIVLVCQKRPDDAASISRRDFQRELREQMPEALETMIGGETGQTPIAPVDLAQAAIGPGMAIFSKYAAVLNQDGSKMSVHDALIMINKEITEFLNPDSGSFDGDTMFCSAWFDQYGWSAGMFGEADTLARAKGTSVDGVKESGVIESGSGKVRLLKWAEYPCEWDPTQDERTPIWEACHHMIRKLNHQGESEAGALLARMPDKGEAIRQLAYHLYTLCERKKWAEDARAYNELIGAWHAIVSASHDVGHKGSQQELQLNFG
jgi:putative DNA methylase